MNVTVQNLSKVYRVGIQEVAALDDMSFTASSGEFVCIVGPSGCGKTTLLKIIAGLIAPTAGHVQVEDLQCSMVFQEHGLFPWMTVLNNVAFGLKMKGVSGSDRAAIARDLLQTMGLETFEGSYPYQLSVGMKQRVGIARALATDPDVLLMDEPFASVDAQTRVFLREEIHRIWQDTGKLILYVTHDIEEAVVLGERVIVMSSRPGRLVADIQIPLSRPRNLNDIDVEIIHKLSNQVWDLLKPDIQKHLWQPN